MFIRFGSYFKKHRKLFIIDLAVAFCLAAIELVYPVFTTRIIDDLIPNSLVAQMFTMVAILLGLYILMAGCDYFMNYWGHVVGVRMEADMRSDMFKHMQKLDFKFYDNQRTGKLMSRMLNDLNQITELAHHGPEDIFISIIMFVGSFIILWTMEWRLVLIIYLGVIPIMIWFSISQRSKMSKGFRAVREETADINAQLENSLAGIRVAKSYTNEDYEIKRFDIGNGLFRSAKNEAYRRMSIFHTGMKFMMSILNIVVLGFGGYFAYRKIITIGELTGFLLYVNLVMQPIRRLTDFTQQFEMGMNGFARFHEIMEEKPDIIGGEKILDNTKGNIAMNDVTFFYNEHENVLKNISLHIQSGSTVALVGPSGGGKTTLCHLLPRFYDVTKGSIKLDGEDIKDYTLDSLRGNIGLVQQDVFLFTGTIRENILYGRIDASQKEMIEAAKKANIHEFVQSLPEGYDTWVGEKGIRLSGGQKQRISITRVFLKNPPILILDEATSALDNETEIKIQQSLEKLSKGRTSLVIAHRLSTIRNADMIVVLSAEGIVEKGSHEELYAIEDGTYKRLYDAQFYSEEHKANLFA
ncbi:MAG: ABC transporter ATP-binding protein [Clostridia bacterium]|nr:ABC transporter ATP-binding protein [Clostridia bacterium]MBT7122497.1 ABC transporter ATP-binding protein [Clostridia bacterium]